MFSLPLVESWNPYVLLCSGVPFRKSMGHCKIPRNPSELVAAHPAWLPQCWSTSWLMDAEMDWAPLRVTQPMRRVPAAHRVTCEKAWFASDPACSQAQGVTIKIIPVLPRCGNSTRKGVEMQWWPSAQGSQVFSRKGLTCNPDLLLRKVKGSHELSFDTSCSDFCILDSVHQGKPCCCLDWTFQINIKNP